MKKWLSMIMVLALLVCLTACGENAATNADDGKKDEPVDLYTVVKEATEKTLAATSYEAKMVYVMDTNMFGTQMKTTADLVMTYNGKEVGVDGKSLIEMAGSKTETPCQYYYDGEYLYMTMLGEGYKMAITEEDLAEEVGNVSEYITVLPEELFEGITGDAENIVLTLDETTLKNLYGEALDEEIGEDLADITIKDGKITLSVKDGYLSTFNVAFTCEVGMGEEDTVTYVFSQETTYTKYGDVTVTPMEGYEGFEEMDDDFLFGDEDIVWEDDELFDDDDFLWDDDEFFEDEL